MGLYDMVWPAARPVEEVSVFARWTSEGAAPKDRPPLFPRAGSKSWAGPSPIGIGDGGQLDAREDPSPRNATHKTSSRALGGSRYFDRRGPMSHPGRRPAHLVPYTNLHSVDEGTPPG
jgi:hypothetical protein